MGWFGGWRWREVEAREPWSGISELEGMRRTRARDVYEGAVERSWRDWRIWGVICLAVSGGVGCWALFLYSGTIIYELLGRDSSMGWTDSIRLVVFLCVALGWNRLAKRMYLARLRRMVRRELGTHCGECDYDLRGTPDLPPPAVARCPECGRVIARNVHRVVVGGRN